MPSDLEALLARATQLEEKAQGMVLGVTGDLPDAGAVVPEGFAETLEAKLDAIEEHLEVLAALEAKAPEPIGEQYFGLDGGDAAGFDPDDLGTEVKAPAADGSCVVCGSTERDEFKDGSASCTDCGTFLEAAGEVGEVKDYDFDDLDVLLPDDAVTPPEEKADPVEEPAEDPAPADLAELFERRKALDEVLAEA